MSENGGGHTENPSRVENMHSHSAVYLIYVVTTPLHITYIFLTIHSLRTSSYLHVQLLQEFTSETVS